MQFRLKEETKAKLVKRGSIIFFLGIALLLIGTAVQITLFVTGGNSARVGSSGGMVWGGIVAALGIPAIVGGRIMQMIGKWRPDEAEELADETETPPRQNV